MKTLSKADREFYTSMLISGKEQFSNRKDLLDKQSTDSKYLCEKVFTKYKFEQNQIPASEMADLTEKVLDAIEKSDIKITYKISEISNNQTFGFKVVTSPYKSISQAFPELIETITLNLKGNHIKEFRIYDIDIIYDEYTNLNFNFIGEKVFYSDGNNKSIDDEKLVTDKMLLRTIVEYNNLNEKLDEEFVSNIFRAFFNGLFKNNIQLEEINPQNLKYCETYTYRIPTVIVPTVRYYKEAFKETLFNVSDILKSENIGKIVIDKIKLSFNSVKGDWVKDESIIFEIVGIKEFSKERDEDTSETQESSETFESTYATANTTLDYKKELMERFNNFLLSLDNPSENSAELRLKLIETIVKNK